MSKWFFIPIVVVALAVCGCATPTIEEPTFPPVPVVKKMDVGVDAGIKVEESKKDIFADANAKVFAARSNPFVLTGLQMKFDRSQSTARILGDIGGWSNATIEVPEDRDRVVPIEPQPFRRLSGIIVGQSVMGLIDMGDGKEQIIRPGMQIPGTEWTVVAIDGDRAILRRPGNKLPHEISVPLQGRLPGGGGAPANPGGGRQTPGQNGAPPRSGETDQ